MKNNVKPLFAIALLIILLFSFSGSALAVREDVCMPDACSHSSSITISADVIYYPSREFCVRYIRTTYRCRICNSLWTDDDFVGTSTHKKIAVDRGHMAGNKHRYRYECEKCHYVFSADFTLTCYGPPCNLPTFIVLQAK